MYLKYDDRLAQRNRRTMKGYPTPFNLAQCMVMDGQTQLPHCPLAAFVDYQLFMAPATAFHGNLEVRSTIFEEAISPIISDSLIN